MRGQECVPDFGDWCAGSVRTFHRHPHPPTHTKPTQNISHTVPHHHILTHVICHLPLAICHLLSQATHPPSQPASQPATPPPTPIAHTHPLTPPPPFIHILTPRGPITCLTVSDRRHVLAAPRWRPLAPTSRRRSPNTSPPVSRLRPHAAVDKREVLTPPKQCLSPGNLLGQKFGTFERGTFSRGLTLLSCLITVIFPV